MDGISLGWRASRSAMAFGLALGLATAWGQVVTVPVKPVVGSSNPATAEPPVSRPATKPCTVTLFDDLEFGDYSAKTIAYAPPKGCTGNWAKVVLSVDFTVTAGIQYDRTASFYLGSANIFYGTTAEPNPGLSPSWHVERDVTDLSALFKTSQSGQAIVYNIVNSTYTGVIYGTAKLLFYPESRKDPAPVVPSVVIPVSGVNSPYELDSAGSELTTTVTAPRNVVKAYLDVIAQGQQSDEFWYFCVPNSLTTELESCGNTPFRETEITIDGQPAGVAPVHPWIFTGGIDPYLWFPITGAETLNFKPYRVDLTPFAGVLNDGQPHTVGVSVFNAQYYFLATANLLLYTDAGKAETGGALLENTLSAAPTPEILTNLSTDGAGNTVGTVTVESNRSFTTKGYVNTSAGRVETTVKQEVDFNNTQTFKVGSSDVQNVNQTSTVHTKTTAKTGYAVEETDKHTSFPLVLDYSYLVNGDGSSAQAVTSYQKFAEDENKYLNDAIVSHQSSAEEVISTDTLSFDSSGNLTGVGPTKSSANYVAHYPDGSCYSRKLASESNVLTKVKDGEACSKE